MAPGVWLIQIQQTVKMWQSEPNCKGKTFVIQSPLHIPANTQYPPIQVPLIDQNNQEGV